MRKLMLLALSGFLVLDAHAAHRVTVAQLEEALSAATAEQRADGDIARQIGGLTLSERLTTVTLNRLAARLKLQPRTALSLQLLSDQSAFLDPPPSELPATAPPDQPEQKRMLQAARGYVVDTIFRLPNFFATRSTHRFDDSPQALKQGEWPVRAGLHTVGTVSRTVTFRDGKETADADAGKPASAQELGLHTWGEFGPELSVILTDLVKGAATFHHWEQVPTGILAVYRYSVPASASHYIVHYCCTKVAFADVNDRDAENGVPFNATPGYHGELSIDPATGAVFRITLETELKPGSPITRADTVVDYGPVAIGDRTFVCPVRSLAVSVEEAGTATLAAAAATRNGAWPSVRTGGPGGTMLLVNETEFKDYHRLGSTARVVGDAPPTEPSKPGTTDRASERLIEPGALAASSDRAASPAQDPSIPYASGQLQPSTAATSQPPPAPSLPAPAPAPPEVPEIVVNDAAGSPDLPVRGDRADTGFSLKVTTRLVDIGLVATDKKGRPLTDLKSEDFEVYDGGRKQEIRFFSAPAPVQPSQSAPAGPEVEQPQQAFSNRATEAAAGLATQPSPEAGGTILLVDESHIAWGDMQNARNHMLKFLGSLPPHERVGFYTMNGIGFKVLIEVTSDHAALIAGLKKFMPTAQSLSAAQEEETRNRQQFDYVHNIADLNSVNGNHADVPDAEQTVDPQLMTMGSNPTRASLVILAQVARHLASIPGHKNLVWVSSDNVLADWGDQQVSIDKSPKMVESFALHAQEAMNEAHATVYPFDVSQLGVGGVGADLQHASVQPAPAQAENIATAGGGGASTRDTGTGRINAAMSQDLHPIQGPVRDLASATGGRPVRRSADLAAELNEIVDDGHATYQLSFSPEGPADDQSHKLTIKLRGRRGVTLRYRTEYLYAKEPVTLKDRFRQAMWRATDVTEIGINAQVAPSGSGDLVKLNIAAGDLGMEQGGGRWMDKLDIFFIQRDDAGLHTRLDGQTLVLRLKPPTYQNMLPVGVPFERTMEMYPGMASLRVLIVDENSGHMGSITIPGVELRPKPLQANSF